MIRERIKRYKDKINIIIHKEKWKYKRMDRGI